METAGPLSVGELVDRALWAYTDHFSLLFVRSLPYLALFAALSLGVAFDPGLESLIGCFAALPFLHLALTPVSRTVWTQVLGRPLPPDPAGHAWLRGSGRLLGQLWVALLTGLSFFLFGLPYFRYYLLIPTLFALERLSWNAARRRSRALIEDSYAQVAALVSACFGLVLLLDALAACLLHWCLPWLLALLGVQGWESAWVTGLENGIYATLAALALPLLEVSLVLLYDQERTFREGCDLSAAIEALA